MPSLADRGRSCAEPDRGRAASCVEPPVTGRGRRSSQLGDRAGCSARRADAAVVEPLVVEAEIPQPRRAELRRGRPESSPSSNRSELRRRPSIRGAAFGGPPRQRPAARGRARAESRFGTADSRRRRRARGRARGRRGAEPARRARAVAAEPEPEAEPPSRARAAEPEVAAAAEPARRARAAPSPPPRPVTVPSPSPRPSPAEPEADRRPTGGRGRSRARPSSPSSPTPPEPDPGPPSPSHEPIAADAEPITPPRDHRVAATTRPPRPSRGDATGP